MRAGVAFLAASALVGCTPAPRCGSATNIDLWRVEDRAPPPDDDDMRWTKRGCGAHDVPVATTIHLGPPLPGVNAAGADVFFLPAQSYAVWLMTHATANAVKGLPIAVEPVVLHGYAKQAITDADGNADLGLNFPGLYVAFTVYDVVHGEPPIRDVYVYERVLAIGRTTARIEVVPTQHLVNPPSTPVPPTYRGELVDVRRVHDARSAAFE